jgi:NADPH:quinone reductase
MTSLALTPPIHSARKSALVRSRSSFVEAQLQMRPRVIEGGQMKAIQCVEHGPPATFSVFHVPRPALPAGYVRMRVVHCGLGFPDLLMAAGKYQIKPPVPFVPGSEVAGVVIEVAPDVEHIRPGDRVAALNFSCVGGLAEEAVMPASTMVRLPDSMPTSVAAGMLVNYGTSYYALVQRGALRRGETVLVLGASGGVGLAAVEIAKALGARVIAAASSQQKLDLARQHGADETFNYSTHSIKAEVMRLTQNKGVDVVFDPVGDRYSEEALRSIAPGGRLLVVGFAAGSIPKIALNLCLLKGCSIVGVYLAHLQRNNPAGFAANLQELFKLHEQGSLRPDIVQLRCFDECAKAFELIGDRQRTGKVVMRVTQERTVIS